MTSPTLKKHLMKRYAGKTKPVVHKTVIVKKSKPSPIAKRYSAPMA